MTTSAPPFDTYRTIERLINSGGFKKEQAEAIAQAVNDGLAGGVATSADIETLRADIETLRADMRADMAEQETRLTIRMGAGLIAIAGLIAYVTNLILSAIAG